VSPSKQQRQRQLARARYERQQARRHHHNRRRRRRQVIAIVTVGAILAAIGLGWAAHLMSGPTAKTVATPTPSTSTPPALVAGPAAAVVPGCKDTTISLDANPPTFAQPAQVLKPGTAAKATLTTNCGAIAFTLDTASAPKASNAFAFLSGKGYYDDTPCHRLTTAGLFILQCGDPTGTGTGAVGYALPDENLPKGGKANYPAGTVAMAEGASGKAGAQFFIVYKDTALPANYTIFGQVTQGLDVVKKVAAAGTGTGADGAPKQAVVISSATVATS